MTEVRWLNLAAARNAADAIADLGTRALEYNVFREPQFMLAALDAFAPDAQILTVWRAERLDAVIPLHRPSKWAASGRLPTLFANHYQPLGTPFLNAQSADELWSVALESIARTASAIVLPHLRLDGPAFAALETAVRDGRRKMIVVQTERRAMLAKGPSFVEWQARFPRTRRKESSRLWRRLQAHGAITTGVATGSEVAGALSEFAVLEASGWKGRGKTALADRPEAMRFATDAIEGLAPWGLAAIDRIDCDGRPIAMLIRLGPSSWPIAWKIAYDETFAAVSPGTRVWEQATERILDAQGFVEANSLATDEHPLAGRTWQDRASFGTVVIGLDRSGVRARLAAAELRATAELRRLAKSALAAVRRR